MRQEFEEYGGGVFDDTHRAVDTREITAEASVSRYGYLTLNKVISE